MASTHQRGRGQGFCPSLAFQLEPLPQKEGLLAEHLIGSTQNGVRALRPPGRPLPLMLLQDGRPGDTTEGNGVGTLPTGFAVGSLSFSLRKDLIRSVKEDTEGHYIMIKGIMQQEDITLINDYSPNLRAQKHVKNY